MQNPVPVHTYHTDGLLLEKPKGKKRYVIVALCLWAVILLYVDRKLLNYLYQRMRMNE